MEVFQAQYHEELKAELEGKTDTNTPTTPKESKKKKKKEKNVDDEEEEEIEDDGNLKQFADDNDNMSKVAMSRKKRRLYEAMKVTLLFIYLLLLYLY